MQPGLGNGYQGSNQEIKNDILPMILFELHLTKNLMAEILEKPIEERRRNHFYSTRLRAVALKLMLQMQVNTLHQWRQVKDTENADTANQQNMILLKSINAIANVLGSTG